MTVPQPFARQPAAQARGFSLLEIMIALALGLLLSVGILSLFGTTSSTNKLQNGLARLQESGRFAVTRMESDLRMAGGQYCSNFGGNMTPGGSIPVIGLRAPAVFAANLGFPDGINSIDQTTGLASPAPAANSYVLSPRYFLQGYSCDSAGDCGTGLPALLPAQGLTAGARLPASDVLIVRYQRGSGWPVPAANSCATGGTLTFEPQPGDDPYDPADPTRSFVPGESALVSDCQNTSIVPVAAAAGNVVSIGTVLPGAMQPACTNSGARDMRVFNFSKDFVTVTYSVELREDESPDARPNSGQPRRLVPALIRRENGGIAQELVRGVDQLKFRYALLDSSGDTRYLTAAEIDAGTIPCPLMPDGATAAPGSTTEPGCLWRAVRAIEAHLLVNTGDEVMGLDPDSLRYVFMDEPFAPTQTTPLPSGLLAGSTLRREFIAFASTRNFNF
jgi:type IV pilus assembly protein PilW